MYVTASKTIRVRTLRAHGMDVYRPHRRRTRKLKVAKGGVSKLSTPAAASLIRKVHSTRQLEIIHLSDLHFGNSHRFDPPRTPAGDVPKRTGYPRLLDKLQEDLTDSDPNCQVITCITGDLATTCSDEELKQAEDFINSIAKIPILGSPRTLENLFIIPGNHDVVHDSPDVGTRWRPFVDFSNRLMKTKVNCDDPWSLVRLHDRIDDLGAVILSLNSAIYVEKGKLDQDRGNLDVKQLQIAENALSNLEPQRLKSAIRIALIHHHPVLIPPLAEPGRGYDAVHNSGKLLTILRKYGFHLILHGHKHNPFTFTDDTQSAFQESSLSTVGC